MRDLNLHIISPSSYGDDGGLLQYSFVLMQPPTFPVLEALVLETAQNWRLGLKNIAIHCINERLEKGDDYLQHIIAETMTAGTNLVFISAKSFELPRAIDIARQLKRNGLQVVIGGAGSTLADWKTYQFLVNHNISFNVGEGEITVGRIIEDALARKLKPVYWQRDYVNLRKAPLLVLPNPGDHRRSVSKFAAIGTSEGCPFNCSFCCVTTLRGRKICQERSRQPEACIDWIEQTHRRGFSIMLTDDNFRRSYIYPELKEGLIKLNKKLSGRLYFFVQLDAGADIINEAADLARMGVEQAFFGMESLDPSVLTAVSKKHNKPELYRAIIKEFHKYEITVNSGIMVGWPRQTPESIQTEVRSFSRIIDLGHIYFVTPFPGSRDYVDAVACGELITNDLNFYDTGHCVRNWFEFNWFEKVGSIEMQRAYWQSAFDFFSFRHVCRGGLGRSIWLCNLKHTIYGRLLAEYGRFTIGHPFHFMMEGPPRKTRVWRPKDSFYGFALIPEDLSKKEDFLTSLTRS